MTSEAGLFSEPETRETLEQVAVRLRERNMEAVVVADGPEARDAVLRRISPGAEVHAGKSKTLQDIGITRDLAAEGAYNYLRGVYLKMDRATQAREIRKLIAAPDFMLGSVSAVTRDGVLVAASATASQLGAYAAGSGKLILVVGSQKIVTTMDAAFTRIREYILPWESSQVRAAMGIDSFVGKILIIEREWVAGRICVVLVQQPVGI